MPHMIDSDICIAIIRARGGPLAQRLHDLPPDEVFLSAITYAELATGVQKSAVVDKNEKALGKFCTPFTILPFDEAAAEHYAVIRATLKRAGNAIGPLDLLIAGHAMAAGTTLVTRNDREFRRVAGLKVETWAQYKSA